jgi:hypothetical protein
MGIPKMPVSNTEPALLVILGAVFWLPISLGAATAIHTVLLAHAASWPAWVQLLHPLATVIAKSKLLVLPVYPAAWPQAKKHPFVQLLINSYKAIKSLYLVRKFGFRYRQARIASTASADRLERFAGLTSAVRWLRRAHVARHFGVEKSTQKFHSMLSRWAIKFSAEYYEAKERQAALHQPSPSESTPVSKRRNKMSGYKRSKSENWTESDPILKNSLLRQRNSLFR